MSDPVQQATFVYLCPDCGSEHTADLDAEYQGYAEFDEQAPEGSDPVDWWRWRAYMSRRAAKFWKDSRAKWIDTAEGIRRAERSRSIKIIEDNVPHDGHCSMGDCTGCQIVYELKKLIGAES